MDKPLIGLHFDFCPFVTAEEYEKLVTELRYKIAVGDVGFAEEILAKLLFSGRTTSRASFLANFESNKEEKLNAD
jgi:hypothetical protein